jgi:hypothetical protein
MTNERRLHLRTVLMWLAVALGVVAIAVTFVPALSGLETYRVGFMAFAFSAVLAYQALEPKQEQVHR